MIGWKGFSIRGGEVSYDPPPSVLVLALPSYLRRLLAEISFYWLACMFRRVSLSFWVCAVKGMRIGSLAVVVVRRT